MLYFFYGQECPHCHEVMPYVDALIEEGVKIEKLETWHNEENAKLADEKDGGKCGGVPFFLNEKSGELICGSTSEKNIRRWAQGKKLE
jgi:thiol-disulfide isomerase/thioredoxin